MRAANPTSSKHTEATIQNWTVPKGMLGASPPGVVPLWWLCTGCDAAHKICLAISVADSILGEKRWSAVTKPALQLQNQN